MRVATYTERSAPSRGSLVALSVLVMTILLGTGVMPTIMVFVGGPFEKILTPLWLLLYVAALLGLMFNHGINWISWLVRYRILLVVLMLGSILSVSWSIDARVSAERTVHLVGSSLLAVYIGFTVPLLTTLRVFAVVLGLCILASIGAAIAVPGLGIEAYEGIEVWRGVFNSKNDLGFWAAVGVLLYITLSDSTQATSLKLLCFLLAGLCLGALALSQSATSLLAMLIAGALSLYFFIAGRFHLGFIRMAFMAVLFTAVIALAIANIDTAELVGRTGDLTGRGEVWGQVWKLILQHPLTGVGYGSLWFPTDGTIWIQQSLFDFTWVVYHAHNGLLQVASEVGMPLAVIALLMVAQQLIEIFYCQYERQQVGVLFVLGFVAAYLVSNYSEARFLVTRELFWIFFLALPISMLRQINLVLTDAEAEQLDETRDYAESTDHRYGATPYGTVPGKPWLGATQQRLERKQAAASSGENADAVTGAAASAGAVAGAVELTKHSGDADEGTLSSDSGDGETDLDTLASTVNMGETTDPLASATDIDDTADAQWLDETDIDLGELNETMTEVDVLLDEPGDLGIDDTLDLDRYDKDFDVSGEWEEVDPDPAQDSDKKSNKKSNKKS
ncbi:O-antigen ligase family protein [Granulosicoccus antarcticus]|uniref:O-antigen ligase-related domain-containing protein n=1 Tax=Granulosicoccus antarcticus IMCC3135 TaxID=1192854 RepID=A0A2Z2NY96_9GAMM|nr:O-antigen ligase [Granulosicoccus antarcticus]ASJ76263.1 hypothetical protein IMCC3135_31070 [Granulosicoccus antarcticus IMCC3135]